MTWKSVTGLPSSPSRSICISHLDYSSFKRINASLWSSSSGGKKAWTPPEYCFPHLNYSFETKVNSPKGKRESASQLNYSPLLRWRGKSLQNSSECRVSLPTHSRKYYSFNHPYLLQVYLMQVFCLEVSFLVLNNGLKCYVHVYRNKTSENIIVKKYGCTILSMLGFLKYCKVKNS